MNCQDFDCWSLLAELKRRKTATTWELAEVFGRGNAEISGSLYYLREKGKIEVVQKGHNGRNGIKSYPATWKAV